MVRTRFAPSPTGYLHIGGVRTALFNWLFARQHGGQFILRIDDTDQERNVAEALRPILNGFTWLGLDWDEGPTPDGTASDGPHAPYFQSQRAEKYQAAVDTLLERGLAYRDYAKPEEVQAEREAAEKEKRPFVYSRRWMAESDADARQFEEEGRQAVVRLKMPREGTCEFFDHIRGEMRVDWATEQDHVIQRADGSCLYHLATVVDDHDFEITHVIRAQEHLSNTPRQIFIAQGLGYELPQYAHLPFVAEPGGKTKLSKRKLEKYLKNPEFKKLVDHGQSIAERMGVTTNPDTFNPVIVDFYREVGYLPDAIVNYILLLGWALDDKTEDFAREEMIEKFTLEKVNKAPASFDPAKLWAFQDRAMQRLDVKKKVALCVPFLQSAGWVPEPPPCDLAPKLTKILNAAGDRIKTAGDILDYSYFFVDDDSYEFDEKAFKKRILRGNAASILLEFRNSLESQEEFSAAGIRNMVMKMTYSLQPTVATVVGQDEFIANQTDALMRDYAISGRLSFDATRLEETMGEFVTSRMIKIGDIIHAARVAITGQPVGMGFYDVMSILGKSQCLTRIERALKLVGTETSHPDLTTHPQALVSPYELNSEPITLYEGDLSFESQSSPIKGSGTIFLQWNPSPSIRFRLKGSRPPSLHLDEGNLRVPEFDASTSAFLTHASGIGRGEFAGVPEGRFEVGGHEPLRRVTFHVANFLDCHGAPIQSALGFWAGRLTLAAPPWKVVLDADLHQRERTTAAAQFGYAVTHVGELSRDDGELFAKNDADDVLTALQHWMSFARGFWVAPILANGWNESNDIVWRDWSIRSCDRWRFAYSWLPRQKAEAVEDSFRRFCEVWFEPSRQKSLRTAVYWYLASNSSRSVDRSIITAFIPIEVLADCMELAIDHSLGASLKSICEWIGISDPDVPDSFREFREFQKNVGAETTIDALVALRNLNLHPIRSNLAIVDKAAPRSEHYTQAWQILQWIVELAILKFIDYSDRYSCRTTQRSVWETQVLPWAKVHDG